MKITRRLRRMVSEFLGESGGISPELEVEVMGILAREPRTITAEELHDRFMEAGLRPVVTDLSNDLSEVRGVATAYTAENAPGDLAWLKDCQIEL